LPIWGLHFWLPMAHVEAPSFGSIILAGVLLKLGGVGAVRFGTRLGIRAEIPRLIAGYCVVALPLATAIACIKF